jgi:hypothetical protein
VLAALMYWWGWKFLLSIIFCAPFLNLFYLYSTITLAKFSNHVYIAVIEKLLMIGAAERG